MMLEHNEEEELGSQNVFKGSLAQCGKICLICVPVCLISSSSSSSSSTFSCSVPIVTTITF